MFEESSGQSWEVLGKYSRGFTLETGIGTLPQSLTTARKETSLPHPGSNMLSNIKINFGDTTLQFMSRNNGSWF